MKPVDQQILGEMGDCFTASLATLLDLPYEEVPYFISMGTAWHEPFFEFLDKHGYKYKGLATAKRIQEGISLGVDGYFLVSGGSPRGFKSGHSVIYKGTVLFHDPHPSRMGVLGEPMFWMIERSDICTN